MFLNYRDMRAIRATLVPSFRRQGDKNGTTNRERSRTSQGSSVKYYPDWGQKKNFTGLPRVTSLTRNTPDLRQGAQPFRPSRPRNPSITTTPRRPGEPSPQQPRVCASFPASHNLTPSSSSCGPTQTPTHTTPMHTIFRFRFRVRFGPQLSFSLCLSPFFPFLLVVSLAGTEPSQPHHHSLLPPLPLPGPGSGMDGQLLNSLLIKREKVI